MISSRRISVSFLLYQDFDVANVEEREKIKLLGGKFVMFCLEVVYMMNKWLPI